MSDFKKEHKKGKLGTRSASGFAEGVAARHHVQGKNYEIKFKDYNPPRDTSVVNVIDKTALTKDKTVFRIDGPHKGAEFNHLNINPKISKLTKPAPGGSGITRRIPHDPHLNLGGGARTLNAYKNTAKGLQMANRGLVVGAVAADTVMTGYNVYEDYQHRTTRNTVEGLSGSAGGWGGGAAGAAGGAALGSLALPGVGTITGGIIGGIAGGIGGSIGASAAAEAIGDHFEYDINEYYCRNCRKKFKVRRYKGESKTCPDCGSNNTVLT